MFGRNLKHRRTEKAVKLLLFWLKFWINQSLKSFEINLIHLFKRYCFPKKNHKKSTINLNYQIWLIFFKKSDFNPFLISPTRLKHQVEAFFEKLVFDTTWKFDSAQFEIFCGVYIFTRRWSSCLFRCARVMIIAFHICLCQFFNLLMKSG